MRHDRARASHLRRTVPAVSPLSGAFCSEPSMRISDVRTAIDYNRALHPALRATHVAWAGATSVLRPLWRESYGPVLVGVVLFALLLPLDGPVARAVRSLHVSGDLKRELTAWQQYGALTSLIVVGAVIALLDPRRARRLLDLVAASALTGTAILALKMTAGRPRPRPELDDPHTFVGPLGVYPVTMGDGSIRLIHPWEVSSGRAVELWSMASSHTAYAVVLSVFLIALYPRLRPIAIAMALLVGCSRVLFQAHWPTDVLAGAVIAYSIARPAVKGMWGVRALDWAWIRWIDRSASPMYPKMAALAAGGG